MFSKNLLILYQNPYHEDFHASIVIAINLSFVLILLFTPVTFSPHSLVFDFYTFHLALF